MREKKRKLKGIKAAMIILIAAGLTGCVGRVGTEGGAIRQEGESQPGEASKGGEEPRVQGDAQIQLPIADGGAISEGAEVADIRQAGFGTPKEAVLAYLAGLRDGDFWGMEGTFWEGEGGEDISRQYAVLCGLDLIPEIAGDGYVLFDGSKEAQEFLGKIGQQIENADFEGMEWIGFIPPEKLWDNYSSQAYQKSLSVLAENSGASKLENQVAVVQVNGSRFLLFFDTIERDGRWHLFRLGGILAHMLDLQVEKAGVLRLDDDDEKLLGQYLERTPESLPDVLGTGGSAARKRTEAEGVGTPQEAAAAYLVGLKACDADQMLRSFSVESYGENYDLLAYAEYTQMYLFMGQDVKFPGVNTFARAAISYDREKAWRRIY